MINKGKTKLETLKSHLHLGVCHELVHESGAGSGRKSLPPKYWLPTMGVSNCFKVKGGRVEVDLAFWWGRGHGGQWEGRSRGLLSSPPSTLLFREQGSSALSPTLLVFLSPPHPTCSQLHEAEGNICQHSFIQQYLSSTW